MSTKRKKLGLIFSYDEAWIGGTYYIINLIHALDRLPDLEKPEILVFSNPKDYALLQGSVRYPYMDFERMDENPASPALRLMNRISGRILGRKVFRRQFRGVVDAVFPYQKSNYLEEIPVGKRIYWIPDFQDKHLPHFFTEKGLRAKQERCRWIATNAEKLLLSSESVYKDWKMFYPDHHCQVKVVHFACTHPPYASLDIGALRAKFDLPETYFFSPNQFWAHKNQMLAIRAVELLREQGHSIVLAFSGKENDNRNPGYVEGLKAYVADRQLHSEVRFLGFLDRREQLQLMQHARAIIQPSRFEGWSTVIEDAMAMNQPVLASDLDVNREQLGTTGRYFGTDDAGALAGLMLEALESKPVVQYDYDAKIEAFGRGVLEFIALN